jgi:hypothetical protein
MSAVHRRPLDGDQDQTIFTGSYIDDYVVANGKLVLVQQEDKDAADIENSEIITIYDIATHKKERVALPEPGGAAELKVAPDGRSFGFVFTPKSYKSNRSGNLLIYRFAEHDLQVVKGFNGKPVKVIDWIFAKDGTSIAVDDYDSSLSLIRQGMPALPLGQYTGISGFSSDGKKLYVGALDSIQLLDLQTTKKKPLTTDAGTYILTATPFHTEASVMLHLNSISSGESVALEHAGKIQHFDLRNTGGYLGGLSLAPNDQYAALELQVGADEPSAATIIDAHTGKPLLSLPGGKVRWEVISS